MAAQLQTTAVMLEGTLLIIRSSEFQKIEMCISSKIFQFLNFHKLFKFFFFLIVGGKSNPSIWTGSGSTNVRLLVHYSQRPGINK